MLLYFHTTMRRSSRRWPRSVSICIFHPIIFAACHLPRPRSAGLFCLQTTISSVCGCIVFRVVCRFERHFANDMTGRRGQWRVLACMEHPSDGGRVRTNQLINSIGLPSTKYYPRGSIIRPHKELNRVLAQRKVERQNQMQFGSFYRGFKCTLAN